MLELETKGIKKVEKKNGQSIPQFSYWFNRKSKIIYRVYNMSLTDITHYDNNDNPVKGRWNNKASLTSLNSDRRSEYIIRFDTLRKNYKFIAESVSEDQGSLFINKGRLVRYQCAKRILKNISSLCSFNGESPEDHTLFSEQSQIVNEYEEMIGLTNNKKGANS
jgi:hypothetical protein